MSSAEKMRGFLNHCYWKTQKKKCYKENTQVKPSRKNYTFHCPSLKKERKGKQNTG